MFSIKQNKTNIPTYRIYYTKWIHNLKQPEKCKLVLTQCWKYALGTNSSIIINKIEIKTE